MLASQIEKNCSGLLTIWGIKCTFSFSEGYLLEIRPVEAEAEAFKDKCQELKNNYDSLDWIHGQTSREYDVAFLPSERQGSLCYFMGTLTLVISIVLQTRNFKGSDGQYLYAYKDLQGFNAIDFMGNAVDLIFPPKAAIKRSAIKDHRIEWLPYTESGREYDTIIQGVACKLIFTILIDREDLDLESTSLGTIRSTIRLAFSERQDLSMIEPCWQAICTFLSFCVGQYNVTNLDIGLWDEEKNPGMLNFFGNIACAINDDKGEDIRIVYPAYYRFQINSLGEKIGLLFHLLNDVEGRPILGFLPRKNTDITVDRNKIRDLCTALEVEYDYRKEELSDSWINELVVQLKETVKQFRQTNPDKIDDNENSYINSSISAISRPARKKLLRIFNRYKSIIDKYADLFRPLVFSYQTNTSDEATEKDIGWIVKTRNSITHSAGITDTVIPNRIYDRLKISVFCSILERASYSMAEIETIIEKYFQGDNYAER